MKKYMVADLMKAVESEEETYQRKYNDALDEYTRDPFSVKGTSTQLWGDLQVPTVIEVVPELDEDSLGSREDIINGNINNNPSYTIEVFGYSYELDLQTLDAWIKDPKMSYYNANIRVKKDPF
jgi:hypothetical protein